MTSTLIALSLITAVPCPELPHEMVREARIYGYPELAEFCIERWNSSDSTFDFRIHHSEIDWQGEIHPWTGEVLAPILQDLTNYRTQNASSSSILLQWGIPALLATVGIIFHLNVGWTQTLQEMP